FLATCRGYGIGVSTIIQTLTQLQDKYNREKAESILGNCSVKICMNAANHTTAKYFSDLLGKTTVKIETTNSSSSKNTGNKDGGSTSHSDNESYSSRDLMTPDEIINMNEDTQLIILSNHSPIKAGKAYQFKLFPEPKELLNQNEYKNKPKQSQVENYKQHVKDYEAEIANKEQERQEKISELEKSKQKAKQEENEKATESLLADMNEDSLDSPIDI